jgi:hypothetical protein
VSIIIGCELLVLIYTHELAVGIQYQKNRQNVANGRSTGYTTDLLVSANFLLAYMSPILEWFAFLLSLHAIGHFNRGVYGLMELETIANVRSALGARAQ